MTLLDAGPLVALMGHRESQHEWTKAAFASLALPLTTCQPVLTETFFLLRSHPAALARLRRHIAERRIVDGLDFTAHAPHIMELMQRYADAPMSFADACLVALAEQTPNAKICTLDHDFLIYRQHGGKPLELIAPFVQ